MPKQLQGIRQMLPRTLGQMQSRIGKSTVGNIFQELGLQFHPYIQKRNNASKGDINKIHGGRKISLIANSIMCLKHP